MREIRGKIPIANRHIAQTRKRFARQQSFADRTGH
jgi:hypothetical protein